MSFEFGVGGGSTKLTTSFEFQVPSWGAFKRRIDMNRRSLVRTQRATKGWRARLHPSGVSWANESNLIGAKGLVIRLTTDETETTRMSTNKQSVKISTNPCYPWFLQNGEGEMVA
jgi:hypothetical protein